MAVDETVVVVVRQEVPILHWMVQTPPQTLIHAMLLNSNRRTTNRAHSTRAATECPHIRKAGKIVKPLYIKFDTTIHKSVRTLRDVAYQVKMTTYTQ